MNEPTKKAAGVHEPKNILYKQKKKSEGVHEPAKKHI
jgi:hypothetical protein